LNKNPPLLKSFGEAREERMNIIKPGFIFEEDFDGEEILKKLERYGRTCYKSEDKITPDSSRKLITNILASGHESVIEHEKITVRIICDRGVSHEVVRHRIASYSQESTRYCNYSKGKFNNEITVIDVRPHLVNEESFDIWFNLMLACESAYNRLIELGNSPQIARDVLPNSLKTEIVITFNLREWRHFFRLRCSSKAHPQMREVTIPLFVEMKKRIPVIFDDLDILYCQGCEKKLGIKRVDLDGVVILGVYCDDCWGE
jgi:thymidylate synthase (FAD)